jgi:hypothetical protein
MDAFFLRQRELRFAAVRNEKLVAEARKSSATQRKEKLCCSKPLPSNS